MEWMMRQGGLTGLGVSLAQVLLALFSVLSLGVMVERALALRRLRQAEDADYRALREMLAGGRREEAGVRAADSPAPCAAALHAGLSLERAAEERVREAIGQELAVQSALLGRNLPTLATVASTAPYIGLFGTVLGILAAFGDIARTGQTGAGIIAGGISEALITTALGLGVAIPAVIAYNYFAGRVGDLSLRAETHALDLTARLLELQTAAVSPQTLAPPQTLETLAPPAVGPPAGGDGFARG